MDNAVREAVGLITVHKASSNDPWVSSRINHLRPRREIDGLTRVVASDDAHVCIGIKSFSQDAPRHIT
jgi:hypothetical protein